MSSFGNEPQYVYLLEERTYGLIVGPIGAYYTMVRWVKGGIEYETLIENEDYINLEDWFLGYGDE